jgi:hypothetical protein
VHPSGLQPDPKSSGTEPEPQGAAALAPALTVSALTMVFTLNTGTVPVDFKKMAKMEHFNTFSVYSCTNLYQIK